MTTSMKAGYASSTSGHHVYAWKRDDGQTWDVFTNNRDMTRRRIAVIVGTKKIAMEICQIYGMNRRVARTMNLDDAG